MAENNNKKYCVLGNNIAYTLSPELHGAIFEFLGEDGEYGVADVPPESLSQTVSRLLKEYSGFNVTKPYKESVAKILGVDKPVNTVKSDGAATSTDSEGFLSDYTEKFGAPYGRILLLGAGGAAKSIADALRGERKVDEICVYNRTFSSAKKMEGGKVKAVISAAGKFDAVVNATSLGLGGEQSAPEELCFKGVRYAYDIVYSPPVTPFMLKAEAAGAKAANGLGMLVYQAIAAHEFWRNNKFDAQTKKELAEFVKNRLTEIKQ